MTINSQLHELRSRVLDTSSAFGRAVRYLLYRCSFSALAERENEQPKMASTRAITAGKNQIEAGRRVTRGNYNRSRYAARLLLWRGA